MILLHFKNCLGNGIDVTLMHNPVFDGPIERYMNRNDVTIEYVTDKNNDINKDEINKESGEADSNG